MGLQGDPGAVGSHPIIRPVPPAPTLTTRPPLPALFVPPLLELLSSCLTPAGLHESPSATTPMHDSMSRVTRQRMFLRYRGFEFAQGFWSRLGVNGNRLQTCSRFRVESPRTLWIVSVLALAERQLAEHGRTDRANSAGFARPERRRARPAMSAAHACHIRAP